MVKKVMVKYTSKSYWCGILKKITAWFKRGADEEEIILKSAARNHWGRFIKKAIEFDKGQRHKGYHWFLGIHSIHNKLDKFPKFDLKEIGKTLPKGHWLKKVNPDGLFLSGDVADDFDTEIDILVEKLRKIKEIDKIDLSGLKFKDGFNFSDFIFPLEVSFENSEFSYNADFETAKFFKDACFTSTTFLQDAYFNDAVFYETGNFKKATFHGETAKFRDTIFEKVVEFEEATFKQYPNFTNAKFRGRTIFQRAKFELHAPRLYEAELCKELTWDNIEWPEFPSIFWVLREDILRLTKSKCVDEQYLKDVRENQNAYENLAYQMEKLGKYHDQHLFFRKEMGCRRRLDDYFIRFFYWCYEKLANYGYGVGRATYFWILHMLFGSIALIIISGQGHPPIANQLECSLFTSFANAHSFLFLNSSPLETCYAAFKNHPYFGFIWAGQAILGIPLIFLLGLTLRIRFRIK